MKPVLTGVIEGKSCYSRKIQRQHTQCYSRKNLLEKRKKLWNGLQSLPYITGKKERTMETLGLEVEPRALINICELFSDPYVLLSLLLVLWVAAETCLKVYMWQVFFSFFCVLAYVICIRPGSWRYVSLASNNYGSSWQSLFWWSVSCYYSFSTWLSIQAAKGIKLGMCIVDDTWLSTCLFTY